MKFRAGGPGPARLAGLVWLLVVGGPVLAQGNFIPPTYPGTGPYRRVFSNSDYSYMSAMVYLPGGSSISLQGSDTPYVYTGGWGAGTGPSHPGAAVDAGFQYSPTFNDWSLFLNVAGGGSASDSGPRFKAGQAVELQFEVVQSGTATALDVIANGIDIDGDSVQRELTVTNDPGWVAGGANTLKRMTSIAQDTQNLSDGSVINGVHWYDAMIGQSAATAVPWLAAETGGYESYPTTAGIVNVQYVNASEETDSINLTPVPEPSTVSLAAAVAAAFAGRFRRRRPARMAG